MPKIKELTQNRLLDEYIELNEAKKKELRDAFNLKFGYSGSSFWRKLNNPDQIWDHEKEYLADKLKISQKELFPTKGGKK